ncbi:acetylornithine deacetylase [Mesorhizobium sp. B4-1-1]|uniref:acetylornithine deacetylase n=1 Tax=Mesorhizobium sp. B4-1-1 TaxID=2589890 RepID=UPI00112ADFEE|nr:acetylornithine deacetylase [Mesorhizobium sp. B4-1-1]TPI22417.1 acetylornithine deacetylase [Mesorhizobium sp. B4-1-1]
MAHSSAIELLSRLVGFDTVSSRSNLEAIDFVKAYLAGFGVESVVIPDATGTKANLFATIGPADRPGYVLSGHTDVVPVDGQEWSRDPFNMWRDGDRLYGRGTSDMKGFVACALAGVPAMLKEPLAAPIHLALSYDEEVGCLGVHGIIEHMAKTLPPQLAVFVGEPTGMGVVGGHKGSAGLLTTVTGKACHSSRPDLGVNAIFHAMDLMGELRSYANDLRSAPEADSPFELPYTTVSVGVVQGGTARNAIPGDCAFQWDIRATRGGVVETLVERFRAFSDGKVVPAMKEGFAGSAVVTNIAYDVPPFVLDAGSHAETLAKRFAGRNEVTTVNYGSEAGIFQSAGMSTIVCGPGRDSEAHITDEWITVEQLERCFGFIDRLIDHARHA